MYSRAGEARVAVKPSEIHRLKIYVELIRFHYGGDNLNANTVHKLLHYDRTIGEDAQRNLSDLLRLEAKEDEIGRAKEKKRLVDVAKKLCNDFNGKEGCHRASCHFTHACTLCGKEGHAAVKCPKTKAT